MKSIIKSSFFLSSQYDYIVLYRVVFPRWFPSHSHADLYVITGEVMEGCRGIRFADPGCLVTSTLIVAPDTSNSGHQVLNWGCSNLSTTSFIKVITLLHACYILSCFLCLRCVHVSLCSCRVNSDLVQMLMIHLKSSAQPASCESGTTKTHRRATDLHGSDHDKYPCDRPSVAPVTPAF